MLDENGALSFLFANDRAISEFVRPRTMPILVYKGEPGPQSRKALGTGVPVTLQNRHFILTAGHFVSDFTEPGVEVYLNISASPHRFKPQLASTNFVLRDPGTVDFGYIELHSRDASTIEAKMGVFSGADRIDLEIRAQEVNEPADWVIVAGYPLAEAKEEAQALTSRFLVAFTKISRETERPANVPPVPQDLRVLDVWLPRGHIVSPMPGQFEAAAPTSYSFGGVSGGGCWLARINQDSENWSPTCLRLCGIHAGTWDPEMINDERGFLREVSLVHHLRMIAEDFPELSSFLLARWPEINEVPPTKFWREG